MYTKDALRQKVLYSLVDLGFGKDLCTLCIENSVRPSPTYVSVERGWMTKTDADWAFPGIITWPDGQTRTH